MYINDADGDFAENEFKTSSGSTSFGVYVTGTTAQPDFDAKEGDTGNLFDLSNIASHGAYVAGGSPEFGESGPHDGDNDFINRGSDKFIYNNTGSTVNAESNYWDGTPDTSLFYGDIDDSPHDDDSNSAGPSWKRTLSPYWAGNQMYEEGQYQEALTELLSALQQEPESEKASIAVFKMAKSALKLGQLADQEAFLLNMTKGTHPEVQHMARVWLAYLYATQKKMSKAEEIAFKAPTGTRAERTELLSLVSYYASQGDQPSADRIAGVLRSSHKDEYLEFDLNAALEAPLELSEPLAPTKDKTESVALTNYPNPFNPTTTIRFALPDKKFVRLRVFDVLGRQVRTLASRKMSAGIHQIIWDGRNSAGAGVAAGIYFASLKTGNEIKTIKLLLVR